MGKGVTFVVCYSIVLLALFGTFCYLMSIVDPEPLKNQDGYSKTTTPAIRKGTTIGPINAPPERLSEEYIDAENAKYISEQQAKQAVTTSLLADNSVASTSERRKHFEDVPALLTDSSRPKYVTLTQTTPDYTTLTTAKNNVSSNSLSSSPAKGFRRSVKEDDDEHGEEVTKEEDSDSVILKIIDDYGQSRIEIKLGSIGFARKKNTSSSNKSKSQPNILIRPNKSAKLKQNRLSKNTVIKVMPDNSLIVNDDSRTSKYSIRNNSELEDKTDTTNISLDKNFMTIAQGEYNDKETNNSTNDIVSEVLEVKNVSQNEPVNPSNNENAEIKLKVLIDNETETIFNFGQYENEDNITQVNNETKVNNFTSFTQEFKTGLSVSVTESVINITDNILLFKPDGDRLTDASNRLTSTTHPVTLRHIDFTEFHDSNEEVTVTTIIEKPNETTTMEPIFDNEIDISEKFKSAVTVTDNLTEKPLVSVENNTSVDKENNKTSITATALSKNVTFLISNDETTNGVVIQLTTRAKVKSKQTATVDVRDLNDVNGNITKILVKRCNS